MVPPLVISICVFPVSAWIVSRLDRVEAGAVKHVRFTNAHQSITFSRRMMLLGGAQAAVGAMLIGRMGWMSVAQNPKYQLLSESNRVQLSLVPPRRGWIIDRYGKPIAINRASFRVDIIPQQMIKGRDIVGRARQTARADRRRGRADQPRACHVARLPAGVGRRQRALRAICRGHRAPARAPGVAASRGFTRFYPAASAVGHLVGYVGTAIGRGI